MDQPVAVARFTRMEEGTKEDYEIIARAYGPFADELSDRVLAHFRLLGGSYGGMKVDRLTHSLQTATRADRGGRDEEYVVCALLHDIGDTLAAYSHAQLAGAILAPFVSESNLGMVEHHAIFQGYYFWHHVGADRNAREKYRGHPSFERTEEFCALYDQCSFDPDYDTAELEYFEPMVRRVLAKPKRSEFSS